jgi:nitrite reductase (NADH) small subunit
MTVEKAIGRLTQIPAGEGRTFNVDGERLAVFHTRAGGIFALQADCPHRIGPLADGLTGGTTVVCPLHERAFDLRTGAGIGHQDCVKSYPVRMDADGSLLVMIGASGPP